MSKRYPLSNVSCKYGAPMGRPCEDLTHVINVSVHRVKMSSCGAYDDGGAYWGIGKPLYRAAGEHESGVICESFVRANSRAEAIALFELEPHQLLRS